MLLAKYNITLELLANYLHKQNNVLDLITKTLMDMTKMTIFEKNIDDNL